MIYSISGVQYSTVGHSSLDLSSSIVSVPVVPQPGHDVLVLVEVTVHGPRQDLDLRVVLGHGLQTLGAADQVEEENIFSFDSAVLNSESFTESAETEKDPTLRTSRALMAEPPVANIGSTRMTKLSLIFFGSFL